MACWMGRRETPTRPKGHQFLKVVSGEGRGEDLDPFDRFAAFAAGRGAGGLPDFEEDILALGELAKGGVLAVEKVTIVEADKEL